MAEMIAESQLLVKQKKSNSNENPSCWPNLGWPAVGSLQIPA
jgi:hypothetical protein